jgi:hypothetical protein
MSLFANIPRQETFRLVTDWLASKRMKILIATHPSYIKAEFGSWTSISFDNAKGEVEAEITERDGGTHVDLNFSFFKEYLSALLIAVFATLALCVIMWFRVSADMPQVSPDNVGSVILRTSLITVGLSAVMFAVAIGIVGYSTALTKRKLIEQFNAFAQSLPFQKG